MRFVVFDTIAEKGCVVLDERDVADRICDDANREWRRRYPQSDAGDCGDPFIVVPEEETCGV